MHNGKMRMQGTTSDVKVVQHRWLHPKINYCSLLADEQRQYQPNQHGEAGQAREEKKAGTAHANKNKDSPVHTFGALSTARQQKSKRPRSKG